MEENQVVYLCWNVGKRNWGAGAVTACGWPGPERTDKIYAVQFGALSRSDSIRKCQWLRRGPLPVQPSWILTQELALSHPCQYSWRNPKGEACARQGSPSQSEEENLLRGVTQYDVSHILCNTDPVLWSSTVEKSLSAERNIITHFKTTLNNVHRCQMTNKAVNSIIVSCL